MTDEPTAAELRLIGAIRSGEAVDHSAAHETIRALKVQAILLGRLGDPRTLVLRDMRITGTLDLEAASVQFPVEFVDCSFVDAPIVEQATLFSLHLTRCQLPGLFAAQVRVANNFGMNGCVCEGKLDLVGARIDGQLVMLGSKIVNRGGEALLADGLTVAQDVKLAEGFRAEGLVKIVGARIGGQFDCDGAKFRNPGETALDLGKIVITEHTYWRHGFRVDGAVELQDAELNGRFDCSGAVLRRPAG